MYEKQGCLPLQGVTRPGGLTGGGLYRDNHVPQEARMPGRPAPFPLWECQDIGGVVLAPVSAVQGADTVVGDEEAADIRLRTAQGA